MGKSKVVPPHFVQTSFWLHCCFNPVDLSAALRDREAAAGLSATHRNTDVMFQNQKLKRLNQSIRSLPPLSSELLFARSSFGQVNLLCKLDWAVSGWGRGTETGLKHTQIDKYVF